MSRSEAPIPETSRRIPRIDRASHLRKHTDQLMEALDRPETLLVPVWRGKSLVTPRSEAALLPTVRQAGDLVDRGDELVWLGKLGESDCFAVDLSKLERPLSESSLASQGAFNDLRTVAGLLTPEEVELLAYARAILEWHRTHRFCGRCGQETRPREGGHVRYCDRDDEKSFPRTDPAIMVLVEHAGRCVLARQSTWPDGMFSVIAGFVEPGESLEDAAIRETREELGLDITDVRYVASQPWPYPASLMLGFSARASSDALEVDPTELEVARWFSRAELEKPEGFFYPSATSLAHTLIRRFLTEGGAS
jgi:NAD+ diphosphatase